MSQGVQTLVDGHRSQLAVMQIGRQLGELVQNVVRHVLHIPSEALALQAILQLQLFSYVAHIQEASQRFSGVEELFVLLVEPRFDDPLVVDGDQRTLLLLRQLAEIVRHEAAVDVADAGTRHPLDAAAALPYLEAQFEVLAAPHQKAGIVGAQLEEVFAVDGEQAAGVGGTFVRFAVVFTGFEFTFRHLVLLIQHAPLEDS